MKNTKVDKYNFLLKNLIKTSKFVIENYSDQTKDTYLKDVANLEAQLILANLQTKVVIVPKSQILVLAKKAKLYTAQNYAGKVKKSLLATRLDWIFFLVLILTILSLIFLVSKFFLLDLLKNLSVLFLCLINCFFVGLTYYLFDLRKKPHILWPNRNLNLGDSNSYIDYKIEANFISQSKFKQAQQNFLNPYILCVEKAFEENQPEPLAIVDSPNKLACAVIGGLENHLNEDEYVN